MEGRWNKQEIESGGGFSRLEGNIPAGLKAAEIIFFNSEAAFGILCEEKEALSLLEGQDAKRY